MVHSIKSSRESEESKRCNRLFNYVLSFYGVAFSVRRLNPSDKTAFMKESLKLRCYNSFKNEIKLKLEECFC